MSNVYRFGVSLDKKLITEFDKKIRSDNYKNRSEAIRDLIRSELVREQWRGGNIVAGAITITYDHHKRELVNKLMDLQHDFISIIISTQHVHLNHDNCLEIIAVKGKAHDVNELANRIRATKGAFHVSLSMSTTGENLH
jgi:CopG family nickel-responsive transcriptional regulator